jgi:hypothetical protein
MDKADFDDQPCAVPLHELLLTIPRNATLNWEEEMGEGFKAYSSAPVGEYCHLAAEALRPYIEPVDDAEIENAGSLESMCMTWRHDYGLLEGEEKEQVTRLMRQLHNWHVAPLLRAYRQVSADNAKLREYAQQPFIED